MSKRLFSFKVSFTHQQMYPTDDPLLFVHQQDQLPMNKRVLLMKDSFTHQQLSPSDEQLYLFISSYQLLMSNKVPPSNELGYSSAALNYRRTNLMVTQESWFSRQN